GSAWIQKGGDIDGEAAGDKSGWSVRINSDGNTVAIGAPENTGTTGNSWNERGHVRIYQWNGSAWIQKGTDIDGDDYSDLSGKSVSMSSDGNTVAIGAPSQFGNNSGHVLVFAVSSTNVYACDVATGLNVSPITPTSARLNWSNGVNHHHVTIRGRIVGTSNWLTITIPAGSPTYKDVFSLNNGTTYEWQLITYCNAAETIASQWSSLHTFTAECQTPDSIWIDPISSNGVRFNWTAAPGAAGFEIKGRRIGGSLITLLVGNLATSKDVLGLLPGTTYEWTIRSLCNQTGTLTSAFTPMDTFVTLTSARFGSTDLNKKKQKLNIYPNPISNQGFIEYKNYNAKAYTIRILDGKGMVVFEEQNITDSKTIFNRKNLSAGMYFVEIIDEGVSRKKFMVE
ncbi:MAG TPA: T9SS type A sorting domain-containing protein, partial [Flavobacteriales bacterium]|nr:T9SS type A sorting domain-containing protein [Flavobacteriales bacterium]